MGVIIRYVPDAFRPSRFTDRECASGIPALDAVRATFPDLIDAPLIVIRNSRRLRGDELLMPGDLVMVGVVPQAGITAAMVVKWVVAALISAAVSYLVGALTKPKARSSNAKAASPSYSINLDQNAARLGEIVPVVYGRVRLMPDIASQPYSEFINNNERAYMILCMGMGEFTIHDVYVGDTRVADLPTGNVQYWQIPAANPSVNSHWQTLGPIEQVTGVCEDMATVGESTGIDIQAPNDPSEAAVIATLSGATLTPVDPGAWNVWTGLVPGKMYNVSNSAGGGTAAVFVGIGPNNSAVWDRALPSPPGIQSVVRSAIVAPYNDAQHGTMAYISPTTQLDLNVGELILIQWNGNTLGPFEVVERRPNSMVWNLGTSGAGWTANMGPANGVYPSQAVTVQRNAVVSWYVSEYIPGVDPAEPYRWLGWFMTGRSDTLTNKIFVDVVMPNGIAWITDKGNYVNHNVTFAFEIQQVDSAGNPVGLTNRQVRTISGATTTARKVTWALDVAVARYRIRVARLSNRDQAASKEISNAQLFSVRYRVWHPANTPAYEDCTMLVMAFTAGSGLAAAANRRVTVDCSRMLYNIADVWTRTSNPADIVRDAYTNTTYGGGRPVDEYDFTKFAALRPQWDLTPGFNAVYDQQVTLIEAMQQMLNVVRAIPTPRGKLLSVTQDCPRGRSYVFDEAIIVDDSLNIGYNFDGTDIPDCLEVVYTDPVTFADARVYYPSQGVRPESLELFGCTNATQAAGWAKCVWQDRQLNHKTCEFQLEAEGYMIGPLDRFGVAVPVLTVGASGRVLHWNPDNLTIEVDGRLPEGVNVMSFIADDGKTTAPITITYIDPTRTMAVLASAPTVPLYLFANRRDATVWRAGVANSEVFEFQTVNIQTAGALKVGVSGKQYNNLAYAGTFLENWISGD